MLVILLNLIFFIYPAFSSDLNHQRLPWEIQKHVETRAIKYHNHCKHHTTIDFRENHGLWKNLVKKDICKRGSKRSLAWAEKQIETFKDEIFFLNYALVEYEKHINLYKIIKRRQAVYENETFQSWLQQRGLRNIDDVIVEKKELQSMRRQQKNMLRSFENFVKKKTKNQEPDYNAMLDFICNKSLRTKLGKLNYPTPQEALNAVQKHVKNIFCPDLETEDDS